MTKVNLKKINFSKELSNKKGYPLLFSKKIIDNLIDILILKITKGNLILKNFGTFKILNKNERIGRNPKTKEIHIIKKRKTISFVPSKAFIKKLNNE